MCEVAAFTCFGMDSCKCEPIGVPRASLGCPDCCRRALAVTGCHRLSQLSQAVTGCRTCWLGWVRPMGSMDCVWRLAYSGCCGAGRVGGIRGGGGCGCSAGCHRGEGCHRLSQLSQAVTGSHRLSQSVSICWLLDSIPHILGMAMQTVNHLALLHTGWWGCMALYVI